MGNSRAYPVFRSTDVVEAWTQALRLNALLEEHDDEVALMAELVTVEDVHMMAAVLPSAEFSHHRARVDTTGRGFAQAGLDIVKVEDSLLEPELPVSVLHYVPPDTVEDEFVRALGRGIASIGLSGRWPDDAETDSVGVAAYDGVEVVFNGDDVNWSEPAGHHTVFVHVGKWGDLPRAEKLAAFLGGTVLGDAQHGW
ncbi:hypothetical protein [Streptomyces sp. NBC_00425]|uniref:hypothetical protein n=1 Tax=Streptomyces sp. NBC_00425 TaxID=2975740 RepID=UPI002E1B12FD